MSLFDSLARGTRGFLALFLVVVLALPGAALAEDPLPGAIAEILKATPLEHSRVGVLVYDLKSKKAVYERNADELLNPASNMKLVTTAAALARLGPDYRFSTEIFASEPPADGVVKGDLYLRGKGDPSLDTERLFRIVRELGHLGIREIRGQVVVDDTFFDREYEGPGWEQDDSDRPYMAGAGALSLNFNAVAVHVHPAEKVGAKGRVILDPPSDYLVLENRTETVPARSRRRIRIQSIDQGPRQKIVVTASLPAGRPGGAMYRRISNPPMYTGQTFRAMLQEQGIKVRGKVRLGEVPDGLRPIHVSRSEPLAVLIHKLNKWSQNHMSEMLLKTLGAEMKGAPGTWAKGSAAVEDFLAEKVGIPRGSFVMRNGSGLNDTNRISARQLVKLLAWAKDQALVAPELLTSLPIAGRDGTTRHRMGGTDAEGRVRAKTGTLQNVTALSGYATAVDGRQYAFSILVNDYPGRLSRVLPGVDAIGAAIASHGSPAGSGAAVALARPPPSEPTTPLEALRARMVTYHNLGQAADARNATFLRTALRTERDPALRAVIAEALYLSEPEEGAAAQAVLDAFSASPDVFGRLREAARGLESAPTPLVSTLIDLAAEGREEAVSKLLGLATVLAEDDPVQGELAVGLAEIGRTAPDELLAALNRASEAGRTVAVRLLGTAIGGAEKRSKVHPFKAAVSTAAKGPDSKLATFARSLESQLTASIEQAAARSGDASSVAVP